MSQNEPTPSAAVAIPLGRSTGDPPATATAPPARASGRRRGAEQPRTGIGSVLTKLIDAAKNLSPHDRIRLLAGVLLVAALLVMLPFLNRITSLGFLLIALVSATLVMIIGKDRDRGMTKAVLIFAFAIFGIMTVAVAPKAAEYMGARIATSPIPGPPQRRPVFGKVVGKNGGRPLMDVSVRTRGDGVPTRTDSAGRFTMAVPEAAIRENTLEFYLVRGPQVDTVSHAMTDDEITLVFSGDVAEDGAAERPAASAAAALHLAAPQSRSTARLRDASLAVIVDSIYTIYDGSGVGGAEWSFDVKVPDGTPIHVRRTTYDDRAQSRIMAVGTETDVRVSGDTVTITVQGVRQFLALWKYQLRGSVPVAFAEVPADRPLRRDVLVSDGRQHRNGQFRFFFTILKLPNSPAG
jgi:hypothetical protein